MARPALEAVYDPPDGEVDIVAVHGLGANADWTWIWKDPKDPSAQVRWLCDPDMLPVLVPKARVILYNYDSRWHSNAPRITLQICGDRFIQSLHDFRKGLPKRPIVFLGHSLGSNVIQQGLLVADMKDELRYLTAVTSGLITLGSPLRGIKKNVQPTFLVKLLQFRGSWGGIIDELKYENDGLLEKLERFIRLAKARQVDIFCFFELYETKFGKKFFLGGKFGVPLRAVIVPETSACLSGFDRCGLQADHFRMNKFSGPNDPSFTRVASQLLHMCTKAASVAQETPSPAVTKVEAPATPASEDPSVSVEIDQCLRSLFLGNPMDDLATMKRMKGDRADGTCEWIIETDEMRLWLSQAQSKLNAPASNFLWLQGDPGVGKSTMAVFLVECLMSISKQAKKSSVAFFFCSSTLDTRNSVTAILRGLLWQLLSQNRSLVSQYVLAVYKAQGNGLFDSCDSLWSMFVDIVRDRDSGIKYLIVDGLDECKGNTVFSLLKMIKLAFGPKGTLRDSTSCRMLVLSRPSPDIQRPFRSLRAINLSASPEIREDIARFIEERVSDLEISIPYPPAVTQHVAQELKRKAGGTFLWAGIACAELEKCDAKDALQCLETLPSTLNDLYINILASACGQDADKAAKIRRLLGFATTAMYPLSILELSAACKLHTDQPVQLRCAFMLEEIESCRRLLIVDGDRVHVLHESVKDFLQSEASGTFINMQLSHAELARRCIEVIYWSAIDVEHSSARRLLWSGTVEWTRFDPGYGQIRIVPENTVPGNLILLGYAMFRWAAHAKSAGDKFTLPGLELLFFDPRSVLFKAWAAVFLAHLMQPLITSGHSDGYAGRSWLTWTPLDVAALTDIPALANFALGRQRFLVEGRHLMYAAVERHWDMFNTLISHITGSITVSEHAIVKFIANRYGWFRAAEVLRILFTHSKITVLCTPRLLFTAIQHDISLFYILLDNWPSHLAFDPPSIHMWMDVQRSTDDYIEASSVLAELRVPGFVDNDPLMERLVSIDSNLWPNESVLKLVRTLCRYRGKTNPITLATWLKAARNSRLGPDIVRLLPTRDLPDHSSDQESLIIAAVCNSTKGAQVLDILFDKEPTAMSPAVTLKIISVALEKGVVGHVDVLTKHSSFDQSHLQEEGLLVSACSNTCCFMTTVFLNPQVASSRLTEKVLLAAAKNQSYGKDFFTLFFDLHEGHFQLSEPVLVEAAQSSTGLLDLLLDREAFDKTILTSALYDHIEMRGDHPRSGNLTRCLLRRRDPALPVPDIRAVARYLSNDDFEQLLVWQGKDIITKEIIFIAAENIAALHNKVDLLSIIHTAKPRMVMVDTGLLEYLRLNHVAFGSMASLVVDRVREIRGGHLLAEEEEAMRIWWPLFGSVDMLNIREEILENRQKYVDLEAEAFKTASVLNYYSGSTGDVTSRRERRASCCFPLYRQENDAAVMTRRNSLST